MRFPPGIIGGMVNFMLILLLGYLVGSFPTSLLAGRILKGIDIREHGSGNAGATNTFRILGWKAGLAVASLDLAKGCLAVFFLSRIRLAAGAASPPGPDSLLPILVGCAAILGHIFPVFARFRGGKGVGTGAGAMFALDPVVASCCLCVFILAAFFSGFVSLASILASLALPLSYLAVTALRGEAPDTVWIVFTSATAAFIIFMHRRNIGRLLGGEENRFEKLVSLRRRLFGRKGRNRP